MRRTGIKRNAPVRHSLRLFFTARRDFLFRHAVLKSGIKINHSPESGMNPFTASAYDKISENYCKEFYSMLPPFAILGNRIFIFCFSPIFNALNAENGCSRQEMRKRAERKKWWGFIYYLRLWRFAVVYK